MATINAVHTDLLNDTFIVEEAGEVVSATRVCVVDLTASVGEDIGDIFAAASNDTRVPQAGYPLNATWWPNVKCYSRVPRVVGKDGYKYAVRMECQYQLFRPDPTLPIRGSTSLVQIQTTKDSDGNPIVVTYNGDQQRVEVTVPEIRSNFSREVVYATNDPEAFVKSWVGCINSATWRDGAAKTWIVSGADWTLYNRFLSPPLYKFLFSFEYSPTRHIATAAYRDDKGNVPVDVVENVGIKDVKWSPLRDFSAFFGA